MSYHNKTVLITGAFRGIGRKIAEFFAKEGANIILTYHNNKNLTINLAEELIREYHVRVDYMYLDLCDENTIVDLFDFVKEKYQKIDFLINNASLNNDCFVTYKIKIEFMKVLETNVVGTYLVTKHVAKYMSKGSKIINIASDNGLNNGYPESADYDASKAGVISLTHNMAKYYAPDININCVCPGWIDTDMNKELTEEQRKEIESKILLKRFATKKEISNVVLFLASDKSSYVNDSIITVNGGTNNE